MVSILCSEKLGVQSYTHIVEPSREVPPEQLPSLQAAVRRLAGGEPLQYVLGCTEFLSRRFHVNQDVLIPRPETEELVRAAITEAASRPAGVRVLDLCTGSGCIAWSIALEVPGAQVLAVDISEKALALASGQFPATPRVRFETADVLSREDFGPTDILVSNPPYVKESEKALMRANVLDWEPALALFVPDSDPLLFYRAIARIARRSLSPDGWGMVEINEALGETTAEVFRREGLRGVAVHKDFCDKNRFVSFRK